MKISKALIATILIILMSKIVSAQCFDDVIHIPPTLISPTEIVLSKNYTTTFTTSSQAYCGSGKIYELWFSDNEDALITFDGGDPLPYPVLIHGGKNVIVRGLEIVIETQLGQEPGTISVGGKTNPHAVVPTCRGLGLDTKNASVHWVEGLHLDMRGHDADGIVVNGKINETGTANVVIQNSLIEGIEGSEILHGDVLQLQTGTIKNLIFENVTMKQSSEGITISYPVPVPNGIDPSKLVLIDSVLLRNMDYYVDPRYIADDVEDASIYGHFFAGFNNQNQNPPWIMVDNFELQGDIYINHSNPANQYWFMIKDKHFTSPEKAGIVIYDVILESNPFVHYNQSPASGDFALASRVGTNYSICSIGLTADAGSDKILTCTTTQVTLGGSNTSNGATYAWTTSNGNITAGGTTKTATVNKAGTYTLTVSKSGSTTVTDDVVVTEDKTPPTANAGVDQTINSGESTQLTATGGGTYAWSPITGLSNANIANPTASPTNDITYTVTVTGNNGCTDTDQVAITVTTSSPTLTADAGTNKTITCTQTQVTLGGSNTSNGATYAWTTSNGNIISGGMTKTATVDKAGTYTLTVSKPGSTTVTDEVIVTEDKTPPTANAGTDKVINSGESTQLTATGGVSYSWSPTMGLSNANIANPEASPTTTMTYTVTITGNNGCTDTDQVKVTVNGTTDPCATLPIADAGNDVTIEKGKSTQLTATGGDTYVWSPTTGLNEANIANPEASPTITTTYTVTVTDENGCAATDEVTITIVEETFRISNNSFSPNGDNMNDVWNIEELKGNSNCELAIYNRWGNKVFTSDRGYNVPWDGMYNGKSLPTGTYFYILKLGDGIVVKGHVNIIK